ncbi:hypothetical protein IWZ01DRAFT_570178 [Phyllosticta capitalensis]
MLLLLLLLLLLLPYQHLASVPVRPFCVSVCVSAAIEPASLPASQPVFCCPSVSVPLLTLMSTHHLSFQNPALNQTRPPLYLYGIPPVPSCSHLPPTPTLAHAHPHTRRPPLVPVQCTSTSTSSILRVTSQCPSVCLPVSLSCVTRAPHHACGFSLACSNFPPRSLARNRCLSHCSSDLASLPALFLVEWVAAWLCSYERKVQEGKVARGALDGRLELGAWVAPSLDMREKCVPDVWTLINEIFLLRACHGDHIGKHKGVGILVCPTSTRRAPLGQFQDTKREKQHERGPQRVQEEKGLRNWVLLHYQHKTNAERRHPMKGETLLFRRFFFESAPCRKTTPPVPPSPSSPLLLDTPKPRKYRPSSTLTPDEKNVTTVSMAQ